ncbi:MAG: AAA family ATPase [Erythrobacter sp.]
MEARIDHLQERGFLVGNGPADRDRMLTTQQAVAMENKVVALALAGKDSVEPIAERDGVVARLQEQARAIGLRRLNQGQEKAGADILISQDRIHLVQGGAGVGKSAALAPVAAIAREEGRNVVALKVDSLPAAFKRMLQPVGCLEMGWKTDDKCSSIGLCPKAYRNESIVGQPFQDPLGSNRFGEHIPLNILATLGRERFKLLDVLDPLGKCLHPQPIGERGDGADDQGFAERSPM